MIAFRALLAPAVALSTTRFAFRALAGRTPARAMIMKIPTSEVLIVTPAMAAEWLSGSVWGRQRKRAEWHVNRLSIEITKDRLIAGTQIHFCILDCVAKLINGQHTLAAIVKANKPVVLTVLRTVVANEEEMGHLYGRHDRHRGRTPHDAFLGMDLAGKLDLSEPEVNAFATGLRWIENGFRRISVQVDPELSGSNDRIADAMVAWAKIGGLYFDAVRDARHGMKAAFRRGPVVAVGLTTFKHQQEKASKFWTAAADEDGLTRNDPRKALIDYLRKTTSGSGDPILYMRNVAAAWNKFYEDGTLTFLRPSDAGKVGITLRGTPYKAVQRKGVVTAENDPDPTFKAPMSQGVLGEEARA